MYIDNSPTGLLYVRNIGMDLCLTIITCGIWNMIVQYHQIKALNYLLKTEKYDFGKMYLFSLLTCGVYFVYFEYCKAVDIAAVTNETDGSGPIISLVLTLFGLNIIYDAIFQDKLNRLFDKPFDPSKL